VTVEPLFIYKRLALWQKSLCVFGSIVHWRTHFSYFSVLYTRLRFWQWSFCVFRSSGIWCCVVGQAVSWFLKGSQCHFLQGLRGFWRDCVLNVGNYHAASDMVLYPMKPAVLNFGVVYCGGKGVVTLPRFLPYLRVLLNRKLLWSEQDFFIFNSASRMYNMTVTPLRDTYFD
jgi:hypothetical protein